MKRFMVIGGVVSILLVLLVAVLYFCGIFQNSNPKPQNADEQKRYEFISVYLAKGGYAGARDNSGTYTLLDRAIRDGHLAVADLLIRHGANPNANSLSENTPLLSAAASGNKRAAIWLLEHGADIDHTGGHLGYGPIHYAAANNDRDFLDMLLKHDANTSLQVSGDGATPVYLALTSKSYDAARCLITHIAKLPESEKLACGELQLGAEMAPVEVFKNLISICDIDGTDDTGRTALMVAIDSKRPEIAKTLLDEGANVNVQQESKGETVLFRAIAKRAPMETVKLLLEHGADPNIGTRPQSFTCLHLAAARNNIELIKVLLKHGADEKKTDRTGKTPADFASPATKKAMKW